MKTLKTFFITVLFIASMFYSNANEYNETSLNIESIKDLSTTIQQMVKSDFVSINNFFYRNNIDVMKEDIVIKFYINRDKKIKLLNVESKDSDAINYIKQLLDNQAIAIDESVLNQPFRLKIKIDYRT